MSNKNIQKLNWKQIKIYSTFLEADEKRNELLETHEHVKVRRCGPAGTKYKVKVGSLTQNTKAKKGEKDASE